MTNLERLTMHLLERPLIDRVYETMDTKIWFST